MKFSHLKCISCGKEFPLTDVRFTCTCGNLLDVEHDLSALKKKFRLSKKYFDGKSSVINGQPSGGVWHFRELVLPSVSDKEIVSKQEGNTRLYRSRKISSWLGLHRFYLKHEGENPTGSFKQYGTVTK